MCWSARRLTQDVGTTVFSHHHQLSVRFSSQRRSSLPPDRAIQSITSSEPHLFEFEIGNSCPMSNRKTFNLTYIDVIHTLPDVVRPIRVLADVKLATTFRQTRLLTSAGHISTCGEHPKTNPVVQSSLGYHRPLLVQGGA